MPNERITENIARNLFMGKGYYNKENNVYVEEQKSQIAELSNCSKVPAKPEKEELAIQNL